MESESPIDQALFEEVYGELGEDGEALFNELAEIFLDQTPSMLDELDTAVRAEDAVLVERLAHTLKGSCRQLAAVRMSDVASRLEDEGRLGNLDISRELLEGIQREAKSVFGELNGRLSKE